jgi:hypothetical protein
MVVQKALSWFSKNLRTRLWSLTVLSKVMSERLAIPGAPSSISPSAYAGDGFSAFLKNNLFFFSVFGFVVFFLFLFLLQQQERHHLGQQLQVLDGGFLVFGAS